jgi:hypothetical protein
MSPFGSRSSSIDSTSSLRRYSDEKLQTIDSSRNIIFIYSKTTSKRRKREQQLSGSPPISPSPTPEAFLMKIKKKLI